MMDQNELKIFRHGGYFLSQNDRNYHKKRDCRMIRTPWTTLLKQGLLIIQYSQIIHKEVVVGAGRDSLLIYLSIYHIYPSWMKKFYFPLLRDKIRTTNVYIWYQLMVCLKSLHLVSWQSARTSSMRYPQICRAVVAGVSMNWSLTMPERHISSIFIE